jgi:hypothetical protein
MRQILEHDEHLQRLQEIFEELQIRDESWKMAAMKTASVIRELRGRLHEGEWQRLLGETPAPTNPE